MAVTATPLESSLSVRQAADELAASRLRNELFRFRFGTDLSGEVGDNVFRLHIDSIGAPAPDEIWFTNSTVSIGKAGEFTFVECDDYLATHIEVSLDGLLEGFITNRDWEWHNQSILINNTSIPKEDSSNDLRPRSSRYDC